ncbi:hypothetical protein GCM10009775_12760 [Microbacterium aoyamense]|uniref:DUF3137 domain-containing protein n=1 Tax=Microbacterium aoyamense TaxID=344166 RepID=A0ABN2PJ33_9MICO|nr:hypothetical protein [Microbacterium aoyamense]
MPGPSLPFDARPLVEPVDPAAVRAHTKELRAAGTLSVAGATFAIVGIVVGIFAVFFVVVFATIATSFAAVATRQPGFGVLGALTGLLPIVIVAIVIAGIVIVAVRFFRGQGDRRYRLDRFARANGMSYLPQFANPGLPGMIFSLGSSRMSSDLVRGEKPRFVEFANYRYTTKSGKNSTTHRWGYVAVKLDVPLPHIVLDATGNNSLFGSNLPASFDKDQRLSLEGDFDQFFSLYCPAGYERDALYLFTPDIMARFIDNAAALDVEIVDDWLFLYGQRDFSTLDPAMWNWLFSVVAALLDKFAQWSRWRDERLQESVPVIAGPPAAGGAASIPFTAADGMLRPPPGVAAGGLRLKRRVPWITFIIAGGVLLFWLLSQFGFFAAFLGR